VNEVLQALADPLRRTILAMLRHAPLCAGRIADAFPVSRPAVSRHLRVLRKAGLVRDSDVGRERIYELETAPLREIERLLAALRSPHGAEKDAWERRFMALETEVQRVRTRGRTGSAETRSNRKRRAA
jgi:DNA-binding transcriptional ArsR family regulator